MERKKQDLALGIGLHGVGPQNHMAAEGKGAFTVNSSLTHICSGHVLCFPSKPQMLCHPEHSWGPWDGAGEAQGCPEHLEIGPEKSRNKASFLFFQPVPIL